MDYIKRNELGGGNWPTTIVNKNGKKFCSVSYNGRCWNLAKNDAGEILVPFDAYEVHGVRDHERVEDSQATGFSLFGHIAGCGLLCIGDFQTRAEAEAIQFRIENHDL
jgi:hypothetical protein